jgi:hypothetical protein
LFFLLREAADCRRPHFTPLAQEFTQKNARPHCTAAAGKYRKRLDSRGGSFYTSRACADEPPVSGQRNGAVRQGEQAMRKRIKLRRMPFVLLVFFLLLWVIGVTLNEPARVLEQAKTICLSCIGIG